MKKINNGQELNEVLDSNDLVIVKWGAPWCTPCRVIEKTIESIEKSNADTAEFIEVDVDEADEDFVASSGIRNIPVLQFFKDGDLIDKTVGLITEQDLINKIKELKGE